MRVKSAGEILINPYAPMNYIVAFATELKHCTKSDKS